MAARSGLAMLNMGLPGEVFSLNAEFPRMLEPVFCAATGGDEKAHVRYTKNDGFYLEDNWTEKPYGEDYFQAAGYQGRSDLQRTPTGDLAQAIAKIAEDYEK